MTKILLPALTLLSISAFGYFSILHLLERNGWAPIFRASLEEATLPDTGEPLRRYYTGLVGLDTSLTILVRFFYSCAVGERPALSTFTAYFAGQIIPLHAVLVLEGSRAGNKGTALYFPAIWGLAYQCIPCGVTLPIYCAVHLWRSPLSKIPRGTTARSELEMMSIDPGKLSSVPTVMLLGFVLPTILPTLPSSLISAESRQAFLAIWQIFPLWVSLSHRVLAFVARALGLTPRSGQNQASDIRSARKIYRQILFLSGAIHLGTLAFIASPHLRQALFGKSAETIDFEKVFRPMSALAPRQIEALTEGTQTLLQYDMYCTLAAAFVWAMSLSYAAAGSSVGAAMQTAGKLLVRSLLVGPGGAVLWAFWDRDEEIPGAVEVTKKTA